MDTVALLKSDRMQPHVTPPDSSVMSPLVHVDGELTLLSSFRLYFTDLEAEVLQTATNRHRAWPSLTVTMQRCRHGDRS